MEKWANLVITFQFFVTMSQLCTLAFDLTMVIVNYLLNIDVFCLLNKLNE